MNPVCQQAYACGIMPASDEENRTLFIRITDGSNAARRFIEGNMAYVTHCVRAFLAEHPHLKHLRDDLMSDGFLTLTRIAEFVRKRGQVTGDRFNPQGLLCTALRNGFIKLCRKEQSSWLTPAVSSTLAAPNLSNSINLMADLHALCDDAVDRQIIDLRARGYTDEEIAEGVQLSRPAVTRRRQRLHAAYREQR